MGVGDCDLRTELVACALEQPGQRAEVDAGGGALDAEQFAERARVLDACDQTGELTDSDGRAVSAEASQERSLVTDLARDERARWRERGVAARAVDL